MPRDDELTSHLFSLSSQDYAADYAYTAKRFVEEAGGDGVEVHGANGASPALLLTPLVLSRRRPD